MRLVLDTDVVVAALRSPSGASAALLEHALDGRAILVANVALMLEYEAVCTRADHVDASGLSREDVGVFLDGVASLIEPVPSRFIWRPQLRDAADEMVLEAAVNGRADALVTFNRRDFAPAATRFGLRVRLPSEALQEIER